MVDPCSLQSRNGNGRNVICGITPSLDIAAHDTNRPREATEEGRERAKGLKQWEKEHLQKKVLVCVIETEGSLSGWSLCC